MAARIAAITGIAAIAAGCAGPPLSAEGGRRWIDLTHTFDAATIYWPTASGFELDVDSKGLTAGGYWYEANTFRSAEHGGTHLDAPVHFAQHRLTADRVPIERLIGPGVVVDVREACRGDADYQVRIEDLAAWEKEHGRMPAGAIVLLLTGWSDRWPDRAAYLGTAGRGLEATLKLHFPGLHPAAAVWLAEERAIDAVGIDTASIDHGPSRLFHSHRELSKRQVPVFENVAGLDRLPPRGAWIVALPMKIGGGSGGPLRIVASVE